MAPSSSPTKLGPDLTRPGKSGDDAGTGIASREGGLRGGKGGEVQKETAERLARVIDRSRQHPSTSMGIAEQKTADSMTGKICKVGIVGYGYVGTALERRRAKWVEQRRGRGRPRIAQGRNLTDDELPASRPKSSTSPSSLLPPSSSSTPSCSAGRPRQTRRRPTTQSLSTTPMRLRFWPTPRSTLSSSRLRPIATMALPRRPWRRASMC